MPVPTTIDGHVRYAMTDDALRGQAVAFIIGILVIVGVFGMLVFFQMVRLLRAR